MHVDHPGYARELFNGREIRRIVEVLKVNLPSLLKEHNIDAVVVTGKSGIAPAYALLAHIEYPLVVVRKPGESSHGYEIEGPIGVKLRRYIILDDFVSSGDTVRRVHSQLCKKAKQQGFDKEQYPDLVAVLTYTLDGNRTFVHLGDVPLTYCTRPIWSIWK